ncbi:MAG: polysaccharide deacetylase family protein [Anaerolineae bacterium]|nr:polysaccharide deacetylase family protein [Gemmatimonadaceae bacterium]
MLVESRIPDAVRWKRRGDALILAYHNVVPEGEEAAGERSLHLSQRDFAAQLDLLSETHEIVSLRTVLANAAGNSTKPRAALTFDDAYRGAVTAGAQEIAARSLPATIFVAPAFVGGGTFWWDELATPATRGIDPAFRVRALREMRGLDADVRARAAESGMLLSRVPDHARCASEEELQRATAHPEITVASHSWSHANLAQLNGSALMAELVQPLEWLRERFERVSDVLSYPYGLATPATERAAAAAGYGAALCISGGWVHDRSRNSYALPRLNVPAGVSARGFLLRVSGVLGG